jgi:hypothetical protein
MAIYAAGDLSCYQNKKEFGAEKCCLVVESGYSFTHIVPYVLGQCLVRRLVISTHQRTVVYNNKKFVKDHEALYLSRLNSLLCGYYCS